MRNVEFTFEWYGELLDLLDSRGYSFAVYDDEIPSDSVLMRHDVDWSPRKAVRMAEIEAERGVTATYFFLVSSPFYNCSNSEIRGYIDRIQRLGHDIGLHFSTHQHFDSTPDQREKGQQPADSEVSARVNRERSVLETVTDGSVDVVSFHNPPEWVFRRAFPDFISTYETQFFESIEYFGDSVQRWRSEPPFQGEELPTRMQILTHPVLWGESDGSVVDRLREERDYHRKAINDHLDATFDHGWDGPHGF
ncbi:hypothetical protein [Halosimplex marinum]|uniref:hypothetical protein n=1 Tax=Halosimplex marinum TaxID=3396620 RepID=UPI003F5449B4